MVEVSQLTEEAQKLYNEAMQAAQNAVDVNKAKKDLELAANNLIQSKETSEKVTAEDVKRAISAIRGNRDRE